MSRATLTAAEVAELLGCSTWLVYDAVRRGAFPVDPIRIGRRLLWSRAAVEALLAPSSSTTPEVVAETR